MAITAGKTAPTRIPVRRLPPVAPDTKPATAGPTAQPRSPPSASRANMGVPPFLIVFDAMEKVPGQKIPTEKPQIPQAKSETA